LRNAAAGEADDRQPPVFVDTAQRLRKGIAADRVEHHIGAADQFLDPVADAFRRVINDMVRAG
jgi:hypothetical protein